MLEQKQYLKAFQNMYAAHVLIRQADGQSTTSTASIEDIFKKGNAPIIAASLESVRNKIPEAGFFADGLYEYDPTLRQKSASVTKKELLNYQGRVPPFASADELTQLYADLGLTKRQAEVVGLLLCGSSDKQMASHLGIKCPTVRTYMSQLFGKLEVQDRTELVLRIFTYLRKPNT